MDQSASRAAIVASAIVIVAVARTDGQGRDERVPPPRVAAVSEHGDTAWELSSRDTAWLKAREDARCTLYEFLRRLRERPRTQPMASVKARFGDGPVREHMWVHVRALEGDSALRGILANEPVRDTTRHEGDTVRVLLRHVDDWYAVDRDTLIGGFGLRLMRARLAPHERKAYDAEHAYVVDPDSVARRRFGWRCGDAPNS